VETSNTITFFLAVMSYRYESLGCSYTKLRFTVSGIMQNYIINCSFSYKNCDKIISLHKYLKKLFLHK
jgi:hypothetical protein